MVHIRTTWNSPVVRKSDSDETRRAMRCEAKIKFKPAEPIVEIFPGAVLDNEIALGNRHRHLTVFALAR